MNRLAMALSICFFATAAQAELILSPALSYEERKIEDASGTTKTTETTVDVRAGYSYPGGFYIGGIYNSENTKIDASYDEKGTHYGASVGYVSKTWNMIGSYIFGGERTYTGGVKRIDVSGPQVDLAYMFDLSGGAMLGPQLTWRSIEYTKVEFAGVKTDSKYKITDVRPMIALMFMF